MLLDRVRNGAGEFRWARFAVVFVAVAALNVWSLVTGDAQTAAELATAKPVGLTAVGAIGSALAAAVCGFIFASAAGSRSHALNSILAWRAPVRWWLVAAFLPAALLGFGLVLAPLTGEEIPALARPLPWIVRSILFTLIVVGIGEEPGWRGWMLPELQKRFNPLVSSIFLGIAWGLWHFPLFVIGAYPGGPESIVEYLFIGPLVAILFTWLYNRTGGNLLLAIVLHMVVNNSQRIVPATGVYSALLLLFIATLIFTERMWRRRVAPM